MREEFISTLLGDRRKCRRSSRNRMEGMRRATEEITTKDSSIMVTNNIKRISSTNKVVISRAAIQGSSSSSNTKAEGNNNRTKTPRLKLPSRNSFRGS